ncbi:MAG TPA: UvrD-helicase domain-containing protein [Rhodanobacteraceae bacterium]|nr:UvrD-helicase domain-containing protein [Rhodanobacteraceae bacterium]
MSAVTGGPRSSTRGKAKGKAANAAKAPVPADWRELSLADGGRSLIEASAGTGKTWTIAVLYLRLLLERGLSPRQIVVTTFTNPAAAELRERLRGKLQWALRQVPDATAADSQAESLDVQWLQSRWATNATVRAADLQRLRLALAELDLAPILTLHSLCRRILADHPFACGAPFVMGELIADDALREEVIGDLWRRLQQGDDSDPLVEQQRQLLPDLDRVKLQRRLGECLKPDVEVAAVGPTDLEAELPTSWVPRLRRVAGCFGSNTRLCRGLLALAACIEDGSRCMEAKGRSLFDGVGKRTGLAKAHQADAEVATVLDFARRAMTLLARVEEGPVLDFWREVTAVARQALRVRLQARHQLSFDGLLQLVSEALQRESASATGERPLADALCAAWPVALVDEFQDTDGLQYGILDAIYSDADGAPRGRLLMIGDPKQAIYRFRGGDIHAYQRAAGRADSGDRLTLKVNYRSSPALVAAFNQFYAVGGAALGAEETQPIRYQPVTASGRREAKPYHLDGKPCDQPLVIRYCKTPPDAVPERRTLALTLCADEIAGMLRDGTHSIGGKPVTPADIAVLLPANAQVSELRNLLTARGVPCVTSSRSSVFLTDTARELQVVLHAVVHHDQLGALRAAAATRLWGASFSQLQAWGDDVASWQPVTEVFRRWHAAWRRRGVQSVVEALSGRLATRYLATRAGERVLTDLRHMGELLQEHSGEVVGEEELLAWLADCREARGNDSEDAADALQLRIESDGPRVRLMTLHASKGLEFNIVFLPLMWAHKELQIKKGDIHTVSDPNTGRRVADISAEARQRECLDLQDERFRVLYVALTRAIHACHLYALAPARAKKAGATVCTTGTERSALDVILERMQPARGSDELAAATPQICWSDEPWDARPTQAWQPPASEPGERRARPMPPRAPGPLPGRHSFSTLTRYQPLGVEDEAAADDEAEHARDEADKLAAADATTAAIATAIATDAAPHAALQALAAVRGTDFGNAVHAIFEQRAVGQPLTAQQPLVEQCLVEAGVRRRDVEPSTLATRLAQRLQGALEAPLGLAGAEDLRLADVSAADQRAEMEFNFVLERVSMPALRAACAQHGEPDLVPRSRQRLSGLMNGKIDLVFQHGGRFHVLDYKGNHLGDNLDAYQDDALRRAMDQHHYRFQALLYTLAVDRYLTQRLGEAYRRSDHLGECIYLFVRAAGLAPKAGIWRHRFPDSLLDAAGAALRGEGARP